MSELKHSTFWAGTGRKKIQSMKKKKKKKKKKKMMMMMMMMMMMRIFNKIQ
jgi:accessory gene regulator protein AgrB